MSGELEDLGNGIKKGKVYVPLYAEREKQGELQNLFRSGKIKPLEPSKAIFPTDSNRYRDRGEPFKQKNHNYVEHEGELYLLLRVNTCFDGYQIRFSNGEYYKDDDYIFIKVEETDLYVDTEKKENGKYEAYFDTILFSGVPISHTGEYPKNFDDSDMGRYLKVYLQELEKLQQVVREIKRKSELVQYFMQLSKESDSLAADIKQLEEQLETKRAQKQEVDERKKQIKNQMNQGEAGDER